MEEQTKHWKEAQRHEREYYEQGKNLQWGVKHSLDHWKKFLNIDKLKYPTLEVGCGPNGLYNFSPAVIGLDPINYKKPDFIQGIAENLPFKKVEMVICCNGLDHFQNPKLAMSEMSRISKRLILWINIYPRIIKNIVALFDSKHPHHFTKREILTLLPCPCHAICWDVSLIDSHWKTATFFAKLKLLIAWSLGVSSLCIHLEVK